MSLDSSSGAVVGLGLVVSAIDSLRVALPSGSEGFHIFCALLQDAPNSLLQSLSLEVAGSLFSPSFSRFLSSSYIFIARLSLFLCLSLWKISFVIGFDRHCVAFTFSQFSPPPSIFIAFVDRSRQRDSETPHPSRVKFQETMNSLAEIGCSADEQDLFVRILAVIIHLNNSRTVDSSSMCHTT